MGMAGPGAFCPDAQGTDQAYPVSNARRDATIISGVAGALCRHDGFLPGDRSSPGKRHRASVDAGGFGASSCLDTSRPGEARKAIAVPLNAEAVTLIRKRLGKHQTVFSFRGRPITQVSTKAWYTAVESAGIEDFRWHDLHIPGRAGTCSKECPYLPCRVGRMGEPGNGAALRDFTAEHPAPYADRLCALRVVDSDDTNPSQATNKKAPA